MRVEAVWAPGAHTADDRGYGLGTAVEGWRPTGAPDAPRSDFEGHTL